ncbi:hypothetical protein [Caulobacter sp.]|uniref:hypothetical protein n=1 Tax=Caulobacter sp. TaxID=78 RepID=UPI001B1B460D|nr:hypothetical protein [Caulobacter sp.]MBO9546977.1 hypothetical protein [Caulobacter sp.]
MSSTHFDLIDRQLIQAHIDSGQPRYSIVLKLDGGAFIRSWTDDKHEALTRHAIAAAEPAMLSVVTFDHLGLDTVAVTFPPHGKSNAQLKAECDRLIDQMIDRWTLTTRH